MSKKLITEYSICGVFCGGSPWSSRRCGAPIGQETGTGPVYRLFGLPGLRIVASSPSSFAVCSTHCAVP